MRVRASTAAAIGVVIGTWLACGPLTTTQQQPERTPAPGLDGGVQLPDVTIDFDGSGSGLPDAFVPDAFVPDAFVPDAFVPDARVPDARVPDARVPDAAIDAPVPPDDGAGIIDAPGSGSGKRDAGSGSNVTVANLEETSVYRCNTSHGPLGALPIAGAIAFVISRRRRGSSSAR